MAYILRGPRRQMGAVLITDLESGKVEERPTLMCVHCQMHWVPEPGSGRDRGWCFKCNGHTCGKQVCDSCRPWEQQVEELER